MAVLLSEERVTLRYAELEKISEIYFLLTLFQLKAVIVTDLYRQVMGAYLSEPVLDKHSTDETSKCLSFGASSMQGWRVSQEVKIIN